MKPRQKPDKQFHQHFEVLDLEKLKCLRNSIFSSALVYLIVGLALVVITKGKPMEGDKMGLDAMGIAWTATGGFLLGVGYYAHRCVRARGGHAEPILVQNSK